MDSLPTNLHPASANLVSARRISSAVSVRLRLVNAGVESNLLKAVGSGESNPVASNETEEGRGKNRRVEITIKK